MSASTDTSYYVGQGTVNLAPRISGGAINGGFVPVGECSSLQISFKQQFVDLNENQTGYGLKVLHAPVSGDGSVKMVLQQWSSANLEKALWATAAANAAGGTVAAETVVAYNGVKGYLQQINVTNVVLKAGATTLVEGTDYTLDGTNGSFTILAGSTAVPAGTPTALTASYTYAANNGDVGAFTAAPTEYSIVLEAKNVANPFVDASNSAFQAVRFQLYRVMFDITKMLDLIGKKDAALELDGELLVDPTVPFTPGNYRSVFMNVQKA